MINTNKLLFILLILIFKTQVSFTQTYITPIVGYEWSIADPYPNWSNYFTDFRIPHTDNGNPKYPLKSWIIGFRASRKVNTDLRLNTGLMYSAHQFDISAINSLFTDLNQMKFKRLRALFGLEHEVVENILMSGDLSFNHIFNVQSWLQQESSRSNHDYQKSRMHLGFQFGLAWNYQNYVIRLQYEYGFWNLKNTSELTATKPIKGFGFAIGYQFEW